MKVIALLPFKNEEIMLPAYLSSVLQVVDEIIGIDDGSTDNSRQILEQAGAAVYSAQQLQTAEWEAEKKVSGWTEYSIRQKLVCLGRQHGGTHFVCLDADEAFTAPFVHNARQFIASLKPGQKLSMQWLALWKSPYCYRQDKSVWSNNFKDFVFCDDKQAEHDFAVFGVGRTPGANTADTLVNVPLEKGAVLHFQFASWPRFQLKQAHYRCWELIRYPQNAAEINQKYAITLDDPNARTVPIPAKWLHGVAIPQLNDAPVSRYLAEILSSTKNNIYS